MHVCHVCVGGGGRCFAWYKITISNSLEAKGLGYWTKGKVGGREPAVETRESELVAFGEGGVAVR